LTAPRRSNRPKPATQDGGKLRCYKRRRKTEWLFARPRNSRQVAMRFDFLDESSLGFVRVGCIRTLLSCYL
jgi:hypothetical protein